MLEHEPQETPAAQIPAAQRRVSAEELTRAVTALEDAKAAERVAGVAPIGQVVDELGLDSTPEEIWAQVEKQRAEAAQKQPKAAVPMMQPKIGRHVRRSWREAKGWIWVLFWCTGGLGLFSGLTHSGQHGTTSGQEITSSGRTITISGDGQPALVDAQGKDVIVSGDDNKLTFRGKAHSVTINGDDNTFSGDAPKIYSLHGDDNNLQWRTH